MLSDIGKGNEMKQPHKNAEILRAIADGDTIEWMNPHGDWVGFSDLKWRIIHKGGG